MTVQQRCHQAAETFAHESQTERPRNASLSEEEPNIFVSYTRLRTRELSTRTFLGPVLELMSFSWYQRSRTPESGDGLRLDTPHRFPVIQCSRKQSSAFWHAPCTTNPFSGIMDQVLFPENFRELRAGETDVDVSDLEPVSFSKFLSPILNNQSCVRRVHC